MNTNRVSRALVGITILVGLWASGTAVSLAQFSSGSTGALGVLDPTANIVISLPPDGVLNYTTVSIRSGVTVTFTKNAANTPVTILATGNVTINGTLSVNGTNGQNGQDAGYAGAAVSTGGTGGPGGFRGGNGSSLDFGVPATAGQGPGGGAGAPSTLNTVGSPGTYGASAGFVSLLPLFGGSGGGGGATTTVSGQPTVTGGGGGGGGGAVVIASSTQILVTGAVTADGGVGGVGYSCSGASGSGGAIRLVAPVITGTGTIRAMTPAYCSFPPAQPSGRIRLEASSTGQGFTGSSTPPASLAVIAASTPTPSNLPTLRISSVGGIAVPAVPTGSYSTADVSLPVQTASAVPVVLTAANTPLNTSYVVRLVPSTGTATTFTAAAPVGTPTHSTATANVTFPTGRVSVLNASASLTLTTLTAGLFPLIDGDAIDHVVLAAAMGHPSTLALVTTSGREYPLSELAPEVQLQVARAFDAMRTGEPERVVAHERGDGSRDRERKSVKNKEWKR